MIAHALIDTVPLDHPAEDVVRVIAHSGAVAFVEVACMSGPDGKWSVQFDLSGALVFAESVRLAAIAATRTNASTLAHRIADEHGDDLDHVREVLDVYLVQASEANGQVIDYRSISPEDAEFLVEAYRRGRENML